jgi:hypothetical protein
MFDQGKVERVDGMEQVFDKFGQLNPVAYTATSNSRWVWPLLLIHLCNSFVWLEWNGWRCCSSLPLNASRHGYLLNTADVCVLNAGSHSTRVDEARTIFLRFQLKTNRFPQRWLVIVVWLLSNIDTRLRLD